MAKNSVMIWKQSIASVEGLPACPEDMQEPVYAALVFDKHCFVSPSVLSVSSSLLRYEPWARETVFSPASLALLLAVRLTRPIFSVGTPVASFSR